MEKFSFDSIIFGFFALVLSATIFLGTIITNFRVFNEDKTMNKKGFFFAGILYVLSGISAFVLCLNAFYTPALQEYLEYRYVASIIFGGFGTLTIPAVHNLVEIAIDKAIKKAKIWAGQEMSEDYKNKVDKITQDLEYIKEELDYLHKELGLSVCNIKGKNE